MSSFQLQNLEPVMITEEYRAAYFNYLPPGYRFSPTDNELIVEYLNRKILKQPLPISNIRDMDIYKFDPEVLLEKYKSLDKEEKFCYFFTPRDRRYENGVRPQRTAGHGYWKSTGKFAPINEVGCKRSLLFYIGKTPTGKKTNWIMHEYVSDTKLPQVHNMKLDEWVLCRIYEKPAKKTAKLSSVESVDIPSPLASSEPTPGTTQYSLPSPPSIEPNQGSNQYLQRASPNQRYEPPSRSSQNLASLPISNVEPGSRQYFQRVSVPMPSTMKRTRGYNQYLARVPMSSNHEFPPCSNQLPPLPTSLSAEAYPWMNQYSQQNTSYSLPSNQNFSALMQEMDPKPEFNSFFMPQHPTSWVQRTSMPNQCLQPSSPLVQSVERMPIYSQQQVSPMQSTEPLGESNHFSVNDYFDKTDVIHEDIDNLVNSGADQNTPQSNQECSLTSVMKQIKSNNNQLHGSTGAKCGGNIGYVQLSGPDVR
ncbi:hypothetical protein GIB67_014897 [Kingdonia uniflora]|uniref:NAC domain-containing protein n=1 Tax=Kingdonia uniflora TaxID=39325 RepID=A0A7J7MTB2_9MAGN|nr:hypothetical protein GIB67_014897 [Kingdonia uniflora]